MSIEFIKPNLFNTTTSIVVNSNTDASSYLYDPDITFQYTSQGLSTDGTIASVRINFAATTLVSRIAVMNHNLKQYRIFYNGATASTFTIEGGDTSASNYSTNSETSQYFRVTQVACTSVSIDMYSTIEANAEKAVGLFLLSQSDLTFPRLPASKGYDLKIDPHDVRHTLSDGGTRIQTIGDKKILKLSYSYLTESFRDTLKSFYDRHTEFIVCPFGTSTGWDGILFSCVWDGPFEFYKFSDNAVGAGFEGKISLMETPR